MRSVVRGLLFFALAQCLCACASPSRALASDLAVSLRARVNLPVGSATDQHGETFTIAGLSGIAHVQGDDYLAVMDNADRLVRLRITVPPPPATPTVEVLGGLTLAASGDHEGVVFLASTNSVLVAEEAAPSIREFSLSTGELLRSIPLPAVYAHRRANYGLESLARRTGAPLSPALYTANEEALESDGPLSTVSSGSDVRITVYPQGAALSSQPGPQFVYRTESWHGLQLQNAGRSGLSDLVALPDGRVLALERSFAFNLTGLFRTRIYEIDFAGATDVSPLPSLIDAVFTPVNKTLCWSGDLSNLEGLCLGPRAASGDHSLIGVVDNGDPLSMNQVVIFTLTGLADHCSADVDASGDVTATDIFLFLDLWFAQNAASGPELRADFNQSGSVDASDIFTYLDAWFAQSGGVC